MTTAGAERLRVLTWNLHGTPNRGGSATWAQQARAWNQIEAADADVALIQEARYGAIPSWATVRWTVVKAEAGRHGKRYPWGSVIVAKHGLGLRELPRLEDDLALRRLYAGGVSAGLLALPDGATALVASVHPRAGQPVREFLKGSDLAVSTGFERSDLCRPGFPDFEPNVVDLVFRALTRRAGPGRFLVGGDWNIARSFGPRESAFFARAIAEGWCDCHALRNATEERSFLPGLTPRQLDHLFCDDRTARALTVCRISRDPGFCELSDHAPLIAEFSFESRRQDLTG